MVRIPLLDDGRREMFPEWEVVAADAVAMLRAESARAPHARALVELVGHLSTVSVESRAKWATHNVSAHRRGSKRIRHPEIGEQPRADLCSSGRSGSTTPQTELIRDRRPLGAWD